MRFRRRQPEYAVRVPPWDAEPHGPFTMDAFTNHGHWRWTSRHLDELVEQFSTTWLPPADGENCGIYDAHGSLLVCYTTEAGMQFWCGSAAGFRALERIHRDPLAVVMYEGMARGDFADLAEDVPTEESR